MLEDPCGEEAFLLAKGYLSIYITDLILYAE